MKKRLLSMLLPAIMLLGTFKSLSPASFAEIPTGTANNTNVTMKIGEDHRATAPSEPVIVRDILPTDFPDGSPWVVDIGWTNGNSQILSHDGDLYLDTDVLLSEHTPLTQSGENYCYIDSENSKFISFYMKDGVLEKINLLGFTSAQNGDYVPQPTVGDILATVEGSFPPSTSNTVSPNGAWVNSTNADATVFRFNTYFIFSDWSKTPTSQTGVAIGSTVKKSGTNYQKTFSNGTIAFNMNGGKLVSISFEHKVDGFASLDGTYFAPVTIADVLATVVGGFPTSDGDAPADAWVSDNGHTLYFREADKCLYSDTLDVEVVATKTVLTKSGDSYFYTNNGSTITFNMKGGVLTSITLAGAGVGDYSGTYSAPVTLADVLGTVAGGFPTSSDGTPPSNAWVNSNNATMFSFEGDLYISSESDGDLPLSADTVLIKDGNNYKCTKDGATVTFVMDEGALVSVEVQNCEVSAKLDGTYTAPAASEYKYTEYENWQIKYGNAWDWSDNLAKVEDGLFQIEILWEGTGFNVRSDENPIKKDWYALEELTIGEEVVASVIVDVYLRVIDDETLKIGVGVDPAAPTPAHTIVKQDGQPATQTESGYKTYYKCPNCGKCYEDAEGLIEIPNIDAWKSKGGDGYLPSGEEIAAAKVAAKAVLEEENAKDPLTNTSSLTNGKIDIDDATTLGEIEAAKNNALAEIREAQRIELEAAKSAAKPVLDAENAKESLTDTTALIEGKAAIDAATTKAGVESAKAEALAAIRVAQASELQAAKNAAKAALDEENAKDPLVDETALIEGKAAIDDATTKAGIEAAKSDALAAIREAQASELQAAKAAAKEALDEENAKDPLANTSSLTNGKAAIDAATTKAEVESEKAEALAAIRADQASELQAAKAAAKSALDGENAKDPLANTSSLANGKAAIDAATTKAGVEAAEAEALAAIREAQRIELEAAKSAAKPVLDGENAKDPLADETSLTNGKAAIDAATTKAGVESAEAEALAAIRAAQASELQAAKAAAKEALDEENAKDPLVDETALIEGKAAIDDATTKAGIEAAKSDALAAIREAQASELQAAKAAAKEALDEENAKDPLANTSSLTNGKAAIDAATTKAGVESAEAEALAAIRAAQASELQAAKNAAKATLDGENANDPLTDEISLANGKAAIDAATTKAGVEAAKADALAAIRTDQASELQAAKAAAKGALDEEESKRSLFDKTPLDDGKRAIDRATTKSAIETAKNNALTAIRDAQARELTTLIWWIIIIIILLVLCAAGVVAFLMIRKKKKAAVK